MKTMKSGEVVKAVTDHSCVLESIISNFKNHKITHDEVINGVWEIFIEKT